MKTILPEDCLDHMAAKYAHSESYHDTGYVLVQTFSLAGELQVQNEIPFTTSFERTGRFRYEFRYRDYNQSNWVKYVVWVNNDLVQSWWDVRSKIEHHESLAHALGGPSGLSGGSSRTIPSLLMPNEIRGRKAHDLSRLEFLDDAILDGIDCYRIQGEIAVSPINDQVIHIPGYGIDISLDSSRRTVILLVQKCDLLLRKIETIYKYDTTLAYEVILYHPIMNISLDDSLFRVDMP